MAPSSPGRSQRPSQVGRPVARRSSQSSHGAVLCVGALVHRRPRRPFATTLTPGSRRGAPPKTLTIKPEYQPAAIRRGGRQSTETAARAEGVTHRPPAWVPSPPDLRRGKLDSQALLPPPSWGPTPAVRRVRTQGPENPLGSPPGGRGRGQRQRRSRPASFLRGTLDSRLHS